MRKDQERLDKDKMEGRIFEMMGPQDEEIKNADEVSEFNMYKEPEYGDEEEPNPLEEKSAFVDLLDINKSSEQKKPAEEKKPSEDKKPKKAQTIQEMIDETKKEMSISFPMEEQDERMAKTEQALDSQDAKNEAEIDEMIAETTKEDKREERQQFMSGMVSELNTNAADKEKNEEQTEENLDVVSDILDKSFDNSEL